MGDAKIVAVHSSEHGLVMRQRILEALECCDMQVVVAVIHTPTGAFETQVNYMDLENKLAYFLQAYDDHMVLKANDNIWVVDMIIV